MKIWSTIIQNKKAGSHVIIRDLRLIVLILHCPFTQISSSLRLIFILLVLFIAFSFLIADPAFICQFHSASLTDWWYHRFRYQSLSYLENGAASYRPSAFPSIYLHEQTGRILRLQYPSSKKHSNEYYRFVNPALLTVITITISKSCWYIRLWIGIND